MLQNELKSVCITLKEIDIASTAWVTKGDINTGSSLRMDVLFCKKEGRTKSCYETSPILPIVYANVTLIFRVDVLKYNNTLYNI